MQADAFRSTERGVVRRTLEGYRAFYPNPLPRRLDLPREAAKDLDEATGAVNRLGGVGLLLPNPHLLIGPYLRIEAVLSSRIEGTRTDIPELLRGEAGETPTERDDWREVANYIVAMEHGLQRLQEGLPMSMRLLCEMHGRLLTGARGHHKRPGEIRDRPNWIGGTNLENAVFVPPPPDAVGEALADWERFVHENDLPLLVQLALTHYQFEVIHPFSDGNGRIGRLMIPLMLIWRGVMTQPLLYLSAFFEQYRDEYFDLLLRTSRHGDLLPWVRFFLRGVLHQARDAEHRTIRLVSLQQELRDQLHAEKRAPSVIRLAEYLFRSPIVQARSVAGFLGVTPPTAYAAIDTLVERGDLVEITNRTRNRLYEAPHIYQAVYGPLGLEELSAGR